MAFCSASACISPESWLGRLSARCGGGHRPLAMILIAPPLHCNIVQSYRYVGSGIGGSAAPPRIPNCATVWPNEWPIAHSPSHSNTPRPAEILSAGRIGSRSRQIEAANSYIRALTCMVGADSRSPHCINRLLSASRNRSRRGDVTECCAHCRQMPILMVVAPASADSPIALW
jgi:hypothetical protein